MSQGIIPSTAYVTYEKPSGPSNDSAPHTPILLKGRQCRASGSGKRPPNLKVSVSLSKALELKDICDELVTNSLLDNCLKVATQPQYSVLKEGCYNYNDAPRVGLTKAYQVEPLSVLDTGATLTPINQYAV